MTLFDGRPAPLTLINRFSIRDLQLLYCIVLVDQSFKFINYSKKKSVQVFYCEMIETYFVQFYHRFTIKIRLAVAVLFAVLFLLLICLTVAIIRPS